jgi:hypothetical protein
LIIAAALTSVVAVDAQADVGNSIVREQANQTTAALHEQALQQARAQAQQREAERRAAQLNRRNLNCAAPHTRADSAACSQNSLR